jgi:hypothetical protein
MGGKRRWRRRWGEEELADRWVGRGAADGAGVRWWCKERGRGSGRWCIVYSWGGGGGAIAVYMHTEGRGGGDGWWRWRAMAVLAAR